MNGFYVYFDDGGKIYGGKNRRWIYCDNVKGITDTRDFYPLNDFIIDAVHVFNSAKSAQKFIDVDCKYFDEQPNLKISEIPNSLGEWYESKKITKKSLKESKLSFSDLCDTLGISYMDISSIRYDDNKGTSYNCNEMLHIGIKILSDEAIQITGFGNFIGAFNFNKYKTYSEVSFFVLEDDKSRYLEIYLK